VSRGDALFGFSHQGADPSRASGARTATTTLPEDSMSHTPRPIRRLAALLALALPMSGCADPADPAGPSAAVAVDASAISAQVAAMPADVNADLARLRATVARLHDFDDVAALGWDFRLEPCFSSAAGGMGLHMINNGFAGNDVLRPDQPEALLFEPQQDGRMRFVGVEFIVPYAIVPRGAQPPVLFGQELKHNDVFQLWALHVWVGRHNPSGLFADWNPNVSCDAYAPTAARHH